MVRRNFDELHEAPVVPLETPRGGGRLVLFCVILAVTTVAAGALAWLATLGY